MLNSSCGKRKVECGRRYVCRRVISSLFPLSSFLLTFLFPLSTFLLTACGGGDDDGRRLGEVIVGTWQRGWNEGDVVIEGETDTTPENLTYDHFVFLGDGSYNGMVRKGSFAAYDTYGDIIYEGNYQCDNHNLKLEPTGSNAILAQVVSFTDDTILLKYTFEEYNITVKLIVRKLSAS